LQRIAIPSSVEEISTSTFNDCHSLSEVVLNEGLQKIKDEAFNSCISLERIRIPSTVDEIDTHAFYGCTHLSEVVLNEGIKRIKSSVFKYCTSLQRITFLSTVNRIEQYAFQDCDNLREVVIHNEEVQIDDKSFYNCTSLERFKFPRLSTRLNDVLQAGQRGIEAKMDSIPTVEWRGEEISIPPVIQERGDEVDGVEMILVKVDKEKLDKIVRLITYYEVKEATTLFELALWKARIDQTEDTADMNREGCRIEVPGPVKEAILQYFGWVPSLLK